MDKTHLTRIINNLVKNSLQAEKPNTPIEVIVELGLESNNCTVLVSDNGLGIANEIKDKIFEPNFTTKSSGMGLGLSMIKKIITDFNGQINYVTSDEGTAFKVTIPIIKK